MTYGIQDRVGDGVNSIGNLPLSGWSLSNSPNVPLSLHRVKQKNRYVVLLENSKTMLKSHPLNKKLKVVDCSVHGPYRSKSIVSDNCCLNEFKEI